MKRIFLSFILLALSFSFISPVYAKETSRFQKREVVYVGSKNSNLYHKPECRIVKRMNPENYIGFYELREAKEAGLLPCKICRPPVKD